MLKRKAFTLVEVLIVVIILGILAAAIIPQFTSAADDGRTNSAAMVAKSMMRRVSTDEAQNGTFPAGITANMFEGGALPRNPLFPSVTAPVFSVSTDGTKNHPATKTSATDTVWWYNSGNGIVRALIPNTGTDPEKIVQYNSANNTAITALNEE
jgi:prepilin-type N-terminal cleavage/methylation domain-containing protein